MLVTVRMFILKWKEQIKQANDRILYKYLFQAAVILGARWDGMITHRRLILAG